MAADPVEEALKELDVIFGPEDFSGPKITSRDLKRIPAIAIKGDFAKAMAPSIGTPPRDPAEAALEDLDTQETGRRPAKAVAVLDPSEVKQALSVSKDPADAAIEEIDRHEFNPVSLKYGDPGYGDKLVQRLGKYAKPLLTALSIDEHLIVKGLSKATGVKEKEDISDYTWTNFMIDHGAPDSTLTHALGLNAAIFLSPTTYLTFGGGAAGKVGSKVLTREGEALVNKIVREKAESQAAIFAGKPSSAKNAAIRGMKADVEQQVLKRFGEINNANKAIAISDDVAALPERIISKGGAKLNVPFTGGRELPLVNYAAGDVQLLGQTVVTGAEIASIIEKSGIPRIAQAIKNTETYQAASKTAQALTDSLGTKFIPNFGVDRAALNAVRRGGEGALDTPAFREMPQIQKDAAYITANWEDMIATSKSMQKRIAERTERAFGHMSVGQREEFANTALNASKIEEKVEVAAKSKDPVVQDALDRWYGQGKYKGEKSIADQLADKSKLVDDKRLANWFPAIGEKMKPENLQINQVLAPSERKFLSARKTETETATTDPVQAITYRATEIAFANLQDKFYDNIIKKNLGDVKPPTAFKSAQHALAEGYVPINRPYGKSLIDGKPRKEGDFVYVQKEFGDYYTSLVKDQLPQRPWLDLIKDYTTVWKRNVTSAFPAFHARNFSSNVILNGLRIGGQAVNPENWNLAARAVLGKGLDRAFVTDIGEKLTVKDLIKEAEKSGAIRSGLYQADIGGEGLKGFAQDLWTHNMWNYANPLSDKFLPGAVGRKFGESIETQARLVNYIAWRKRGLGPKAAAMEVNEALFDYGAITKFEKTLNQTIIPFYTFSRKNLENHVKLLAQRPGSVLAQMKAIRDLGPSQEEIEELPGWARNKFIARFKGNLTTAYGLPIDDVIESAGMGGKELILRTNPVFRYGLERVVGQDFYSGRPIKEVNAAREFSVVLDALDSEKVPGFVKSALKPIRDFLKLERDPQRPDRTIGDPDKLHLLRASWSSRYQSAVGLIANEDKEGWEKAMQFTLGIVRLPNDADLSNAIDTKVAEKIAKDMVVETNTARALDHPIFIGGDKYARKVANYYMKRLKKSGSPSERKELLEELKTEVEEMQRERVEQ